MSTPCNHRIGTVYDQNEFRDYDLGFIHLGFKPSHSYHKEQLFGEAFLFCPDCGEKLDSDSIKAQYLQYAEVSKDEWDARWKARIGKP